MGLVGWWLAGFVVVVAVAWVAYEVTGEIRRKRRIRARERWIYRRDGAASVPAGDTRPVSATWAGAPAMSIPAR